MTRLRNDSGQTAVLTVLFLVALLGAVALVLDVGSWFREQRDTQSAADAAALAGAQALPESPFEAEVLAAEYLGENGGGTPEVTFSSTRSVNDTISVTVTRQAPGVFAKIFGIDSVEVHGKAAARAGAPDRARWAAPIGVDIKHPKLQCNPVPCFNEPTRLDLEKVGPGAFRLLNIDGSRGGTGPPTLAEWINRGFDGLMPLGWYFSDPGAKFNSSHVKDAMGAQIGDELLFPVYDQTKGNGANFEYHVIGWVGFVVTAFQGKGNKGTVDGYFVRVIWEGIQSETGGADDFGVRSIELVE
jgi:putative Flp pilus-assembly TadE/G-like protein